MYKSRNWTVGEWDCLQRDQNDYAWTDPETGMLVTDNLNTENLFKILDALRDQDKSWMVNWTNAGYKSGYRTVAINDEVDGEYNSTHIRGMAADIHIGNADYSSCELGDMVEKVSNELGIDIGLGTWEYDGWCHVDTAGGGRRW